jgi:hypothetical protein
MDRERGKLCKPKPIKWELRNENGEKSPPPLIIFTNITIHMFTREHPKV